MNEKTAALRGFGSRLQRLLGLCLLPLMSVWSLGDIAHAMPTNDKAARRHFESGRTHFKRAEYDDAVREYEQSYALSQRPPLLVNISRAHESAGRLRDAAEALERWMAVAPSNDPMRPDIESRHARLVTQAEKHANQAEPSGSFGATKAISGRRSRLAPWMLVGGGGAALAAGVAVGLLGRAEISDVENPEQGTPYSSVADLADSGPRKVAVGAALAGVGAVAAISGLLWILLSDDHATETNTRVGLSHRGIQVWGRF